MKIIWIRHAENRQKEWAERLGITRQEVENVLRNPEQIVRGDQNVLIAQSRRTNGLLRILFKIEKDARKILTLYWTSRVIKYWQEKKNDNTI